MKLIIKFTLILITLYFGTSGFAVESPKVVITKLVTDTSDWQSEGKIKLGVLFNLKPGWHIYWKNSGDSGLPTKVEFILPDGFKTGELLWPLPSSYMREGNVLDYGYEDSVLLWTDAKVPPDYNEDTEIPLTVKTSWISCEKICIPGKAEIKTVLRLSDDKNSKELFNNWETLLPSVDKKFESSVEYSKIGENETMYKINLSFDKPVQNVEFFPLPGKTLDIKDISYLNKDNKNVVITFKLSLFHGKVMKSDSLDSVVAYTDNKSIRKGIVFPINISNLTKSK